MVFTPLFALLFAGWAPLVLAQVPAQEVELDASGAAALSRSERLELGAEVEFTGGWPHLRDKRLTLVTNGSALTTDGRLVARVVAEGKRTSLVDLVLVDGAMGRTAAVERLLSDFPELNVTELTREDWALPAAAVEENDAVVFDLVLPGPRFAAETMALGGALEAAALHYKEFIVLDRPPAAPVPGMSGPFPKGMEGRGEVFYQPMPMFPAMTPGELAQMLNRAYGLEAEVYISRMKNWAPGDGNEWLFAEPWRELAEQHRGNVERLRAAPLFQAGFPALEAVRRLLRPDDWEEAAMLTRPEHPATMTLVPGALDRVTVMERVTTMKPRGVRFHPVTSVSDGATSESIGVTATDVESIVPTELALQLTVAAQPRPAEPGTLGEQALLANPDLYEGLSRGIEPSQLRTLWRRQSAWQQFEEDRKKFLLYDR